MRFHSFHKFVVFAATVALLLPLLAVPVQAQLIKKEGPLITVRATGRAELGEGTKKGVKEKARLEAIRLAIELHAGVHITSQSTMKNYVLEQDVVSSYQRAYVKSVRELAYSYDKATESGTYQGEFVIDLASLKGMAAAEQALARNRGKAVEATVFFFDGQGRMMEEGGTVRAGDRFNVMVQPAGDLYAYIINRDSQGNLFSIFPNLDVSSHGNPLQQGIKYYFPPKTSDLVFAFDENPGRERFYFLFSAVPLGDIDALFAKLARVKSSEARKAMAPILEERVVTRGIVMQSKSTQATIAAGGQGRSGKVLGELLKGSGAFVKTVMLHHLQ
ncbi:MAG: DUF4384 domain-containing protein [SAR324 cluster bacterium]|nr:DUF4384 domain-containing protein [SAR324 cluster bacterium]